MEVSLGQLLVWGWVGLLERGLIRQVTDRVGLGFG